MVSFLNVPSHQPETKNAKRHRKKWEDKANTPLPSVLLLEYALP